MASKVRLVLFLLLSGTAVLAADKPSEKVEWKKLFDGKTLTGWKVSDFAGPGKVSVKEGAVALEEGNQMTGITYAGKDFPRTDYEFTLQARRVTGIDFFATTTFPVGDAYLSLVMGGWGGTVVGLSSLDSEDASANETRKDIEFKKGQWYRQRVRVSKDRVEVWIDDDKTTDVDLTDRRLSIRIECHPCKPFGIATWHTGSEVRDVRLRKLTEADKKVIAASKPKRD